MSENKQVLEMFEYSEDSPTGLIWKFNAGPRGRKGLPAGSISARGYYQVFHKMKAYRNSRIVWMLNNGEIPDGLLIDHINGIKTDNRLCNLRLATKAQNGQNQAINCRNKTGVKGLCFVKGIWVGQIRCNNERHAFSSKDRSLVEKWLLSKRHELHKEFTNHG